MEAIDTNSYMVSVLFFHISVENGIKIMQISVGVDISMAVSTTGDVYGWGCTKDGRSGVKNIGSDFVSVPHKIEIKSPGGDIVKAVDVEAGFLHSMIVGLDGTLHTCSSVETDEDDSSPGENELLTPGSETHPCQMPNFNIWHRVPEPKEEKQSVKWKKYGKYELKGRSSAMAEKSNWNDN
jgi:hypothetical protein